MSGANWESVYCLVNYSLVMFMKITLKGCQHLFALCEDSPNNIIVVAWNQSEAKWIRE